MTPQRLRDAAKILGELGNGAMANELDMLAERYRWRPISEIHEDYGEVVMINIHDPGNMELGSNLDHEFCETDWTHFSQIVPLTNEQAEEMKAAMPKSCPRCGGDGKCGCCGSSCEYCAGSGKA